jgi:hypothetical protein
MRTVCDVPVLLPGAALVLMLSCCLVIVVLVLQL